MKVRMWCFAAVAAFFALAGSASAAVTASQITTPSSDPYVAFLSGADPTLTVAGTATGGTAVNINCYTDSGWGPLATNVPVGGDGHFSTTIHMGPGGAFPSTGCELRAADPNDMTSNHGPTRAGDPYQGIYLRLSRASGINFLSSGDVVSDFDVTANGPAGVFDIRSASAGLGESEVYDAARNPSNELFDDAGALFGDNGTRSEIRIDGVDAYGTEFAGEIAQIRGGNPLPGQPSVSVTQTVDPATGAATITASEPIVKCGDAGCMSFVGTGVTLQTTWTTSQNGLLAVQNSKWVDTDGQPHTLDALYDFGAESEGNPVTPPSFKFPGETDFAQHATGDTVTLGTAPGVYVYKSNKNVIDTGDGHTPMAAFAYSSPPSGPLKFVEADASFTDYEWVIPYQRTIPVNGGLTLSFAYAQGFTIAGAQALAQGAIASFPPETQPPSGGGGTPPPSGGTPPPSGGTPPVPGRASLVGKPKAGHGKVTLKVKCTGTTGSCKLRIRLLAGKKVYASVAKTVALGKTVTVIVKLNAKGRRALEHARHHRLKLKLTVDQTSPGAVRHLTARRLVVKR